MAIIWHCKSFSNDKSSLCLLPTPILIINHTTRTTKILPIFFAFTTLASTAGLWFFGIVDFFLRKICHSQPCVVFFFTVIWATSATTTAWGVRVNISEAAWFQFHYLFLNCPNVASRWRTNLILVWWTFGKWNFSKMCGLEFWSDMAMPVILKWFLKDSNPQHSFLTEGTFSTFSESFYISRLENFHIFQSTS